MCQPSMESHSWPSFAVLGKLRYGSVMLMSQCQVPSTFLPSGLTGRLLRTVDPRVVSDGTSSFVRFEDVPGMC